VQYPIEKERWIEYRGYGVNYVPKLTNKSSILQTNSICFVNENSTRKQTRSALKE